MSIRKVIFVDDDPSMIRVLELAFSQAGFQTFRVMDSEAALTTIQQEVPDVVFMDVMMPGKDGYQLCREVREDTSLRQQPYIIMLTARGMSREQTLAKDAGANEFMTKPFSPAQLVNRVRQILE